MMYFIPLTVSKVSRSKHLLVVLFKQDDQLTQKKIKYTCSDQAGKLVPLITTTPQDINSPPNLQSLSDKCPPNDPICYEVVWKLVSPSQQSSQLLVSRLEMGNLAPKMKDNGRGHRMKGVEIQITFFQHVRIVILMRKYL